MVQNRKCGYMSMSLMYEEQMINNAQSPITHYRNKIKASKLCPNIAMVILYN